MVNENDLPEEEFEDEEENEVEVEETVDLSKKISPLKAIKNHCRYQCSAGEVKEWSNCQNKDCPLHPFRKGKNPFRKRTLSDEERKKIAERLQKSRKS